ncbi:hypothetical protein CHS0354_030079 [Potamilus streckersoni]|uniref:Anthranilate synthase component 2 n=1 Tax=Potamilus streckersoni TaxID=2493646 RepID=A0AAE0VG33_9BIVA|nr:hypothetical protein CHS0354_030079 [Potamilus streckersoni]
MEEGQHNMQGGQHNMQGGQHNMQGGQHNMQGSKDGRKGRVGNREDCTKNGMGYDVSGDNHRVLKDLFLKEKLTESDVTAALDKIHAEGDLNNEMRTWFNDFAVKAHAILNKEQRQKVAAEIKSEADDNFGEGFFSNWRGERRTNNIKFRLTADLTLNADQQKLLDNMLADFQTTHLFSKDTLKAEDLNAGADKMYTDIKTVFSKQIKPAVAFHNSLNAQQKQLLADRKRTPKLIPPVSNPQYPAEKYPAPAGYSIFNKTYISVYCSVLTATVSRFMILLIDNYDSFTFNLYQYLAEFGYEVKVVRNDVMTTEEIHRLNPRAIVISPGPGRPENAGVCPDVIRRLDGIIPILGICLGHQAMGYVYGMPIISAPTLVHGKSSKITHDGKGVFTGLAQQIEVGRYHSLAVGEENVPPFIEVSAHTVGDRVIMGMRHKQHLTEGMQFHPESLLTPDGKTMLRNFIARIPG